MEKSCFNSVIKGKDHRSCHVIIPRRRNIEFISMWRRVVSIWLGREKVIEAVMLFYQEEEGYHLYLCGEELFQFGYEEKRS